jgi:hypothetical protein
MRKLLGIHAVSPHLLSIFSSVIFVHKFSATQLADAQKGYNTYGPIPRLCIEFTQFPELLSSYNTSHQAMISDLSVDQLVKASYTLVSFVQSHFIPCSLSDERMTICFVNFAVEPITHSISIRQQLKKRFIQEGWEGQLRAYQQFEDEKCFRVSDFAGLVFEVMAQLRFREAITLSLHVVPMVKQTRTRRRKTALWVSQSGKRLVSSPIPITFKPTTTVEYEWSTLSEFRSGVFYVPKLSDQVISDSFILDRQSSLYLPIHDRTFA